MKFSKHPNEYKPKLSELETMNINSDNLILYMIENNDCYLYYDVEEDNYYLESYDSNDDLVTVPFNKILKQSTNHAFYTMGWLFENGFFKRTKLTPKYDFYDLDFKHVLLAFKPLSEQEVSYIKKRLESFPESAGESSTRYFLRELCVSNNIYYYHILSVMEDCNISNKHLLKLYNRKKDSTAKLKAVLNSN